MKKLISYILFIVSIGLNLHGQNVSISGKAPNVVALGEEFSLSYTVNSQVSKFTPPLFDGFSILSGPSTSQSSSMQIINGKVSQSFTLTYSYYLSANKIGKFKIPPAQVTANRHTYQSNEISIEVVKGQKTNSSNTTSTKSNSNTNNSSNIAISNDDVFIRLITNKKKMYQGESLVASIKIYRKIQGVNLSDLKLSSFQGFYKEELKVNNYWKRENINGAIYETAEINRFLLYPQKSGKIIIEPTQVEIEITKQTGWSIRGFFRQPIYKKSKKKIFSPKVSINVIPIPPNKPENFTGAVGNFNMTASIDNDNVKTNDAITLKVVISGNGNLKLAGSPKIHFPPDIEYYNDPKITTNIKNTDSGTRGSKIYEHLLLPRNPGDFHIPPIKFSYFDLTTKTFKTIKSKEFVIHVEKGNDKENNLAMIQGLGKKEVETLGTDIKHIYTGLIDLKHKNDILFGSLRHYMFYIISLLIFLIATLVTRRQRKRNKDTLLIKHVRAKKVARKRLRFAHKALLKNNYDLFYEEALKAMWGYLGDKLKIPASDLSKDVAMKQLIKNGVSEENINNLIELLDKCEFARYAPSSENNKNKVLYENIVDNIGKLEG